MTDRIHFTYEPLRAHQAQAVLLRLAGKPLHNKALAAMLYLADRKSLVETGSTITLSDFYNTMFGPRVAIELWQFFDHRYTQYIALVQPAHIGLVKDPGDDELSDYDIETLTSIYNDYCNFSNEELETALKALPEWESPGPSKMFWAEEDLPFEKVLSLEGWTDEDIQHLKERLAAVQALDHIRIIAKAPR